MAPERWQKIDQLLDALSDCSSTEQTQLLDEACAGDEALRREVVALLAAQQNVKGLLKTPPAIPTEIFSPPEQTLLQINPGNTLVAGMLLKERYLIEGELGRGGVGVVYLAHDTQLHQRRVVVKVLLDEQEASVNKPWFQKKFEQEIEALARIDHHGIVGVLDAGATPAGKPFFVMQFVEGVVLRQLMKGAQLDVRRVLRIVRQIGQALSAAHDKGVVHRDLKPENIMVQTLGAEEEVVKLIDFGIASLTSSNDAVEKTTVAGTLPYMAPEQFRGQPAPASDIWALGVIAYELLTGRLPFQAGTLIQLYEMQQRGVQVPPRQLRPELPVKAEAVILQALAYEPEARFARARDFGEELARVTIAEPGMVSEEQVTMIDSTAANSLATAALMPEMAHILFMDLVGYSKLPADDQVQRQRTLRQLVQQTQEFVRAQQQDQLISLPTGDGMALVFFRDPVAPVQCAIELASTVRTHPEIELRMGVHSGLVYRIADINANRNVAGGGINVAQRVMDCGDAGHILLSSTVAGVLGEAGHWAEHLTDWGEQEVKHGARVHLFNLHTGVAGKADLPEKLRRTQPTTEAISNHPTVETEAVVVSQPATKLPVQWLVGGLLLLALIVGVGWFWSRGQGKTASVQAPPQRLLSYSIRTRPNPRLNPNAQEESLPGEIIFTPGDELRLNFVSPQDGYFYLLNEGPKPANGLPRYNVLFPAADNTAQPTLQANQPLYLPQEQPPWFSVDKEQGTETLWLIWSQQQINELETVRKWLNPKDGGEIKAANEVKLVQEFLHQQATAAKPIAEKDEQQTHLKGGPEGLLIYAMKLGHR